MTNLLFFIDHGWRHIHSLYRLGKSADALGIIQKLPPDKLHDPHATVYVALLLADANQIEAAKDYMASTDETKIYVEEKKCSMNPKPGSLLLHPLRRHQFHHRLPS